MNTLMVSGQTLRTKEPGTQKIYVMGPRNEPAHACAAVNRRRRRKERLSAEAKEQTKKAPTTAIADALPNQGLNDSAMHRYFTMPSLVLQERRLVYDETKSKSLR